jgi:hypothetical protein
VNLILVGIWKVVSTENALRETGIVATASKLLICFVVDYSLSPSTCSLQMPKTEYLLVNNTDRRSSDLTDPSNPRVAWVVGTPGFTHRLSTRGRSDPDQRTHPPLMRHGLKPAPPPYQLSKQLHHITTCTSVYPNYPAIFNPFARDVPATLTNPEPRTWACGKAWS